VTESSNQERPIRINVLASDEWADLNIPAAHRQHAANNPHGSCSRAYLNGLAMEATRGVNRIASVIGSSIHMSRRSVR
jgi:hypothetical protein